MTPTTAAGSQERVMEAIWKDFAENKAFNLGFEIWKDLDICRWEVILKAWGYIEMKKKKGFIENMLKNLSINKKIIWHCTLFIQIFRISYTAKLFKEKNFLKESASQTSLPKNC